MPVSILLVDDHPIVRQGLTTLLNSEPDLEIVGEAEDAPYRFGRGEPQGVREQPIHIAFALRFQANLCGTIGEQRDRIRIARRVAAPERKEFVAETLPHFLGRRQHPLLIRLARRLRR